jgi:hypothetical protein
MAKVCFAVSETKGIVTAMAQTGAVDANGARFCSSRTREISPLIV